VLGTFDSLRLSAIRFPDKTAVVDDRHALSFAALRALANRIGNALAASGLNPGDRVALDAHNSAELLATYYALERTGLVAVPINVRLVGPEIEYIVNHSDARAMLVSPELLPEVARVRDTLGIEHDRYVLMTTEPGDGLPSLADLVASAPAHEVRVPQAAGDMEAIFYTSGTTGFPKGVIRTRAGEDWVRVSHIAEWGFAHEDVNYCVGPLFHNSFLAIAQMHLALGATVVVQHGWDPERALRTISDHGVTTAFLVPTMSKDLVDLPAPTRQRCPSGQFRRLVSSASALPTALKERLLEVFPDLLLNEAYGWTEVMWVTNLRPRDQLRKVRCVGKPLLGARVDVLDEDGTPVPCGTPGEIHARMATGFAGYFKDPERTRAVTRGDLVTGGDIGTLDDEGFLYVLDRKNDMIISGGENIYPIEIDEVLARHPKVKEVAVVGVPHPRLGEVCHATVVLQPGTTATGEELIEFCAGKLARFKWPRSVAFARELPRNAMGKLLKRELRARYADTADAADLADTRERS
jgi:long-chain acyl-CoA synthetase